MQMLRRPHLGTLAQLVATERLLERVSNLVRDDVGTGLSGDGLLSTAHEARSAFDVGGRVVVLCRVRLDAELLFLLLAALLAASEEVMRCSSACASCRGGFTKRRGCRLAYSL